MGRKQFIMENLIKPSIITADSYTLQPVKAKTYITDLAVKSARAFPGLPIPLAGGAWVDKSYIGKIEEQATKVDPEFQVVFRHRDKGTYPTANGKKTYWYKVAVWLVLGDLEPGYIEADGAPTEAATKAARKARKKAKKAAMAEPVAA